jgi:alkylhydroperoxidase family enzyme
MRLLVRFVLIVLFLLGIGNISHETVSAQPAPATPPPAEPFPAATGADTWARLPPLKSPALPEWARRLATPLPKTTAKMIELEYVHRAENPLGVYFAARLRLAVAEALKSEAGCAIARADLKRTERLAGMPIKGEETALAFARQLTLAGSAITDGEFAALLADFTPEQVVAIVHTVAYANFQNRILLGLGVTGEVPVAPPVVVKFDLTAGKGTAPKRLPWEDLQANQAGGLSVRVEWSKNDEDLARTLEKQKERKLRLPPPKAEAFAELTGRDKQQAEKIAWMTVSAGYQPALTRAWFACLNAFYEESVIDRVFANSVFWVVTRTNDCFY